VSRSSKLNNANDSNSAHPWLQERVYAPKRERTIALVKQSIDDLLRQKERVSLASIAATSKTIDPGGQGVSESAILANDQARTYYEQHRSWNVKSRKRTATSVSSFHPGQIKMDRDLVQVRQRYLMRKGSKPSTNSIAAYHPLSNANSVLTKRPGHPVRIKKTG
jgi:hypothetical protein